MSAFNISLFNMQNAPRTKYSVFILARKGKMAL